MTPALVIRDLSVLYRTSHGPVRALDRVSLTVGESERVALVGESGSGKSTIALAALGLLPRSAAVSGRVLIAGTDLVGAGERQRQAVRGRIVSYVPQDTGAALNPVVPVVVQVGEVYRVHRNLGKRAALEEAGQCLAAVGLDRRVAERRLLPHELSGGMRQRALLAMAVALDPLLVVADEPTAALDPEATLGVLGTFDRLQRSTGSAVLLITHDLGVARSMTDRVVVLYRGSVMEDGPAVAFPSRARHPYTLGLAAAAPSLDDPGRRPRPIAGQPSEGGQGGEADEGCPFAPRCPLVIDLCRSVRPTPVVVAAGHSAACHRVESTGA